MDELSLEQIAARGDGVAPPAAAPAAAPPAAAPAPDGTAALIAGTAAEVSGLVGILAGVFAPAFPSLATLYTPEVVARVGQAVAPVFVKRGWTIGGKYGEEMAALAVVAPLALATFHGIKADLAARAPAPPKDAKALADGKAPRFPGQPLPVE